MPERPPSPKKLPLCRALLLLLTPLLCWPTPATAGRGALPLAKLASDEWYGAYLNGVKVGHAHIKMGLRKRGGKNVFELAYSMQTAVTLEGKRRSYKMRSREWFDARPPHKLLGTWMQAGSGDAGVKVTERLRGGKFEVVTETASGKRQRTVPRPRVGLADTLHVRLACMRGVKVGQKGQSKWWSTRNQRLVGNRWSVQRIEPRTVAGVKTRLVHLRERSEGKEPRHTIYELGSGREVQFGVGGGMVMRAEPRGVATDNKLVRDYQLSSEIAVDRPLGYDDPAGIERCVLHLPGLKPADVAVRPWVKTTADGDGVRVELNSRMRARAAAADAGLPADALHALKETPLVQARHPEMVSKAREIVGKSKSPRAAAEKIVRWVFDKMKKERAFEGDALQILRKMSGDCSEHARLTIALARAVGIPAMEVDGITYTGDHSGRFEAHGWVQFWLEGRWVEMDPALGQLDVDATHVRLVGSAGTKLNGKQLRVMEAGDGPAVPNEQAVALVLARLEQSIKKHDPTFFNNTLHSGLMIQRAAAGVKAPTSFRRDFITGALRARDKAVMAGTSWGHTYVDKVKKGGSFKLLRRVKRGEGEPRALFRVIDEGGGINYAEMVLQRLPTGPVKVVDIYNYTSGELLSEQARRFFLLAVGETKKGFFDRLFGSGPSLGEQLGALMKLTSLVRGGKHREALDHYKAMPAVMQREKLALVLRLTAAESQQDSEYMAAFRDLRRFHPKDPSVQLHGIDHFFLKKKYGQAIKLIRRLDRHVGGDPYLKVLEAGVWLERKKYRRALKLADRASALEPELLPAQDTRLTALVKLRRWDDVIKLFELLEKRFELKMVNFDDTLYKAFRKTKQYRKWMKKVGEEKE